MLYMHNSGSAKDTRYPAPLSIRFNVAVLHIAGRLWPRGYDVSDDAPADFPSMIARYETTGRHTVWAGASDRTIFGDPEVNYAFRAWHDWHHIQFRHDFSDAGERNVYEGQRADLRKVYGNGDTFRHLDRYLKAEVLGQLEYKKAWGAFPEDQRGFVRCYVEAGPSRAIHCGAPNYGLSKSHA
jgi:hypothetical protein